MTENENKSCIKHTIVEVEKKAAHVLVVHFPSSVCLILRNDLPAIL
jgi:hypothetical protein